MWCSLARGRPRCVPVARPYRRKTSRTGQLLWLGSILEVSVRRVCRRTGLIISGSYHRLSGAGPSHLLWLLHARSTAAHEGDEGQMGEIERDHLSARSWMLIRQATSIEKHASATALLINRYSIPIVPYLEHPGASWGRWEGKKVVACVYYNNKKISLRAWHLPMRHQLLIHSIYAVRLPVLPVCHSLTRGRA